jgi:hypothetical protein
MNYVRLTTDGASEVVVFDERNAVACGAVALRMREWVHDTGGVASLSAPVPFCRDLEYAHIIGTAVFDCGEDEHEARKLCLRCRRPVGHIGRYYRVPGGAVHVGCGP